MTVKPELNAAADAVISKLKAEGVVLQRYDANSGSLYLKLDYGVANSIRIADHPGKAHLKYRYNLISGINEPYEQMDEFQRFYWPIEMADACVETILKERAAKKERFGEHYAEFMSRNKADHAGEKGFWRTAVLV